MPMRFEPVYTFVEYREAARAGVAEYEGRPHIFVIEQAPTGESPAVYSLFPVPLHCTFPEVADANLWDPPEDIRRLVLSFMGGASPPALRKLGTFQPVSCGHAPDSFEVCWQ